MHVIISHQQVIFTNLISFYKFFNDMYFTHVIFLLGSNVGRYPQNEERVPYLLLLWNRYEKVLLKSFYENNDILYL